MKTVIRRIFTCMLLLLIVALAVDAQETDVSEQTHASLQRATLAQLEARKELEAAAVAYREGDYVEAQRHSERALAADPANTTAPLFIARAIQAQYRPGDKNEPNVEKAREAIASYQRILAKNPHNEEAYKAVAFLYNSIREEQLLYQWILQRATNPAFTSEQRAEAYVVLASKKWNCAFMLTELPPNKQVTIVGNEAQIRSKLKDSVNFETARECANEGIDLVELAIGLDPENESAWSYKTSLLSEKSKLAEMQNDPLLAADYQKQREVAFEKTLELSKRKAERIQAKP